MIGQLAIGLVLVAVLGGLAAVVSRRVQANRRGQSS